MKKILLLLFPFACHANTTSVDAVIRLSNISSTETYGTNEKNQLILQAFSNGDKIQFAYDEKGKLNYINKLKNGSQWADTVKLEYNDRSKATLQDNKKILAFNRLNEDVVAIKSLRHSIPLNSIIQISYHDYYRIVKDTQTIEHILPEGGMLTYRHDSDNKIKEILWTPRYGQKTRSILNTSIHAPGYIFGNQLVFRAQSKTPAKTQLSLWNAYRKQPVWTQELNFSTDGTLTEERTSLPARQLHSTSRYSYDSQKRLINATVNTQHYQQNTTSRYQYSWNPDGSNASYTKDASTATPQISRDASGLPTKVGNKSIEFDNDRKPAKITLDENVVAEYSYNFQGQRVMKYLADRATFFYYENNRLIGEWGIHAHHDDSIYANNGAISRRYIYAGQLPVAFIEYSGGYFYGHDDARLFLNPGSNTFGDDIPAWIKPYLVRMAIPLNQRTAKLFFIHADHIGQPFMVTDENRNIRWLAQNSPTGESHVLHADIEFNLRLPGQYYDQETGWHYNGNRYYDPAAGHYPEPEVPGVKTGLPPFAYANHQPRRFINPLGLFPIAFDDAGKKAYESTSLDQIKALYTKGSDYYAEPQILFDRAAKAAALNIIQAHNNTGAPFPLTTPTDNNKPINLPPQPENQKQQTFLGPHAAISGAIKSGSRQASPTSLPGMYSDFSTLPLTWVDWRKENAPQNCDPVSNDAAAREQKLASNPESKHYYHHPDLSKASRETADQLIARIPANIPWFSFPGLTIPNQINDPSKTPLSGKTDR